MIFEGCHATTPREDENGDGDSYMYQSICLSSPCLLLINFQPVNIHYKGFNGLFTFFFLMFFYNLEHMIFLPINKNIEYKLVRIMFMKYSSNGGKSLNQ